MSRLTTKMMFGSYFKGLNLQKCSKWKVIGSSVIGYSHLKKAVEKQDYLDWYPRNKASNRLVLVVADGHGSKMCFRSAVGSKFATEASVEVCKKYIKKKKWFTKIVKKEKERRVFLDRIRDKWLEKISQYHVKNAFNETEKEVFTQYKSILEKHPEKMYGTTLLLLMRFKNQLCCFQIGDGDFLFINEDSVYSPMSKNKEMIANETYSLCSKDYKDFYQFFHSSAPFPQMILLSTDGYSNSFSSEEDFYKVGQDLLEMKKTQGIDVIEKQLPGWLEETSKYGSGDDISVGLVYED